MSNSKPDVSLFPIYEGTLLEMLGELRTIYESRKSNEVKSVEFEKVLNSYGGLA